MVQRLTAQSSQLGNDPLSKEFDGLLMFGLGVPGTFRQIGEISGSHQKKGG